MDQKFIRLLENVRSTQQGAQSTIFVSKHLFRVGVLGFLMIMKPILWYNGNRVFHESRREDEHLSKD
ncbi:MAG: hypothetical protein A2Y23_01770 [Clostridiales bacterium GWB2_37_7]|nr:MAG: hypothetical protein A2Y23_01770 [Clostridiales bacterium GWB2_37_7]